jgi:predicted transcriptional regulator
MKRTLIALAAIVLLSGSVALAGELQPGQKASDWSFANADGTVRTLNSWAGKVLLINYVDPDESDLNEHFTDAVKRAKDDGFLKSETYTGIGIADCAATWKPNFAIRAIAGSKAKKYHTTILFDYHGVLRNAWGLKKDTSNIIILDKQGICRAIIRGRVPDDQVAELVKLTIELQTR